MNAVNKLIIHHAAQTMSEGGGRAAMANMIDDKKRTEHIRAARQFVDDAIAAVKSAHDYPGWSDEQICQMILDEMEKKK